MTARARITCPAAGCRADNDARAEVCVECLTPLAGYARLSAYPDALFNHGLRAARAGDNRTARDLFAAVVHWQPPDLEARNAHALACLSCGDRRAARSGWEYVLEHRPGDELAQRGLAWLEHCAKQRAARAGTSKAKAGTKVKPRGKAKARPAARPPRRGAS